MKKQRIGVYQKMKKTNKEITAHVITALCILVGGILLYHLITNDLQSEQFHIPDGQGTRFDLISDSGTRAGFNREAIIYTENGITSVAFSGKITVEGSAEISIVSDNDGSTAYSETYSDVKAKTINLEVTGLTPYSYYTLRFYSNSAKMGKLALTTDQSLVKSPERPEKTAPTIPKK